MLEGQTDILNVLLSRATVHEYSANALPPGVVEIAIEAALAAPNHRLTEPWRFVQVGPRAREELAVLQARLKGKGRVVGPEDLERTRHKMLTPPELLAVCRVRHPDPTVEREDYGAIACALQNFSLCLWAQGIGSKWSTGAITSHDDTYAILGVDAQATEIVGFLWAGYPARPEGVNKPPRRLGLSEVLRRVP